MLRILRHNEVESLGLTMVFFSLYFLKFCNVYCLYFIFYACSIFSFLYFSSWFIFNFSPFLFKREEKNVFLFLAFLFIILNYNIIRLEPKPFIFFQYLTWQIESQRTSLCGGIWPWTCNDITPATYQHYNILYINIQP